MTTHDASSATAVADDDNGAAGAGAWRFTDLVRIIALFLLLGFATTRTLRYLGGVTGIELFASAYLPRTHTAHVGHIALFLCSPLAIWWTVGRRSSPRRRLLGLNRPESRKGILAAAVLCTILLAVKIPLAWYLADGGGLAFSFVQDPQLLAGSTETLRGWSLLVTLLSIGPLVAIGEELEFRAVLFGWLRQHLPAFPAALLSSAVFAATHGLEGAVFAFVSGLAFAWLYHRSSSLWPGIAVHAVNNATTVLLLAAAP